MAANSPFDCVLVGTYSCNEFIHQRRRSVRPLLFAPCNEILFLPLPFNGILSLSLLCCLIDWPADLDDTLYPGDTGIGLALKRNIDEFLVAKLGATPERAAAMRVDLFRTYGSSLAGLIVRRLPSSSRQRTLRLVLCLLFFFSN